MIFPFGVSTSQGSARDQATSITCDRYGSCQQIGAGLAYETRSSCEIDWRARWESAWPAAACDGKIDTNQLSICLSAIRATDCGNFGDFLNTLGKCAQAKVCPDPSHPG
jgi:hypothetical protein